MTVGPTRLHRSLRFAAWAGGGVVVAGALALALLFCQGGAEGGGGGGLGAERLPRRAVAGVIAIAAFLCPLLFACTRSPGGAGRLASALGGAAAGAALFAAALDPGAAVGTLAAMLYVLAWSAFAFGLSGALASALGSRTAGRTAAVLLLLAAATTAFTTGRLLKKGLEESPGLRRAAVRLTVAANPFLMANRALTSASGAGADYLPRQGPILYDMWIGTDFPFAYPAWWALAVRWIALGAALWAAAEWLPRRLSRMPGDTVPG